MKEILRKYLKTNVFMEIAQSLSKLATCPKRQVGCVITDKNDNIISIGYNGVARGDPHCIENSPCQLIPFKGTRNNNCLAIHAEQNALLKCNDINAIDTIYCTTSPCIACMKLIVNTSCNTIFYKNLYCNEAIAYAQKHNILTVLLQ